ncbi:hypothetical protein JOD43_003880 [Pullulanibacillus pueri]|uniref:Aspartyl-phosphate phosphatase Spo0E family protein n=1 Tax=Pullulanibacillus pueri TaxID=1437324 RepID=A0A8J2ZXY5_9BACL|nr:aspartyl-phosphate phosphatase Spo0E family protein [Pullulanibacillus pueri]MBM7683700.1 hypothetical protein [Pullulanibacillus pueri]GGH85231.1 hypothetical protein GCM10007096_30140 [Pullulanibacillus pueri]
MLKLEAMKENDLMASISKKRKEMLEVAKLRGLVNHETVRQSHELDNLIVVYQKRFTTICNFK